MEIAELVQVGISSLAKGPVAGGQIPSVDDKTAGLTPLRQTLEALRRAAIRFRTEPTRILDIALGCGFGDVSNFNRTFSG